MNQDVLLLNPLDLKPHPDNPRGQINPDAPEIIQLAADVEKRGIIQPIIITPDKFILAGHRRRAASVLAGLTSVPAIIRNLKPGEFAEDFFIAENMQRQDLSPLEEARVIENLRVKLERQLDKKITKKELARRLEMQPIVDTQRLAVLELPERIQKLFHHETIALGSAMQLLKLKDYPDEIERFADQMVSRRITLNSLSALIARRLAKLKIKPDRRPSVHTGERKHDQVEAANARRITRESAASSLARADGKTISLHNFQVVFDQTCCNCGMMGENEICASCPLPKFINAVVGRSSGAGDYDEKF